MAKSIGKQLHEARTSRGLTVEDVQHKTRIPKGRLEEMENDDYSNFGNLTYAKSFLSLYSKFLRVDISPYLAEFAPEGLSSTNGYAYLQGTTDSFARTIADDGRSRRGYGLAAVLLFLAMIVGGAWWYGNRNRSGSPTPLPTVQNPAPAPESTQGAPTPVPAPASTPASQDVAVVSPRPSPPQIPAAANPPANPPANPSPTPPVPAALQQNETPPVLKAEPVTDGEVRKPL